MNNRDTYDVRRVMHINHSYLITLPIRMTRALNIQPGDYIEITQVGRTLVVKLLVKAGKNEN